MSESLKQKKEIKFTPGGKMAMFAVAAAFAGAGGPKLIEAGHDVARTVAHQVDRATDPQVGQPDHSRQVEYLRQQAPEIYGAEPTAAEIASQVAPQAANEQSQQQGATPVDPNQLP